MTIHSSTMVHFAFVPGCGWEGGEMANGFQIAFDTRIVLTIMDLQQT